MPFVHNRRLRRIARSVPGLAAVSRRLLRPFLLRRGTAELDYPRARIVIRTDTEQIVHSRLRPLAKEPWTVSWIERNLRENDVLYDIGANIGAYALIAAKAITGPVRIVAIEPGFANFASLCENIVLNGVGERVTALPIVLGERTRLGSLNYADVSAGAALHTLDGEGDGGYRQAVLIYGLDDLLRTFDLPAPTLVKLDVDGSEAAVLAGARETLRRPELRSVVVEVENATSEDVLAALDEAGLVLVERVDDRHGEPLPGIWYGIFERPI